jgi:septin family protein
MDANTLAETIKKKLETEHNIGFLVVGDSGVGKTTLICDVIPHAISGQSDPESVIPNSWAPQTQDLKNVQQVEHMMELYKHKNLCFFDTKGIESETPEQAFTRIEKVISLVKKVSDIHFILYCFSASNARFHSGQCAFIKKLLTLKSLIGPKVIIVLTKTDMVPEIRIHSAKKYIREQLGDKDFPIFAVHNLQDSARK